MKNILILIDRLTPIGKGTGKEHINEVLIKSHVKLGYNVNVLVIGNDDQKKISEKCIHIGANAVVESTPFIYVFMYGISLLLKYLLFEGKIKEKLILLLYSWEFLKNKYVIDKFISKQGKPDIITVSLLGSYISPLLAYSIKCQQNINYIIWEHRSLYRRSSRLSYITHPFWGKILKNAHLLLAVSQPLADTIKKSYRVEVPGIRILSNPVKDIFFKKDLKENYITNLINEFSDDRFIFAGWQNWTRKLKRLDLLLDAFSLVQKKEENICLIIAGSIPSWFEDRIDRYNLNKAVLSLGKLAHHEIPSIVKTIDSCVISSDHETFGLQTIEAMAAGKPVLTTICGGPESIIRKPELGMVVESGDAEILGEAMLKIYSNRNSYNGKFIAKYCKENFSEDAFIKRLNAIYGNQIK